MSTSQSGHPKKRVVPPSVHRVQSLRSSGAAGVHGDRRTKRARTRSDRERKAVADESASHDGDRGNVC
jgi:hypothetical protein